MWILVGFAETVSAEQENFGVFHQSVGDRRGDGGVVQNVAPVGKGGVGRDDRRTLFAVVRIPSDADQRSELMAIRIPNSCRSPFQSDGDHRSKLMPITFRLG